MKQTQNAKCFFNLHKIDIIFFLTLISALVLSIWKCRYGFGGNDEAFYLTIPHRISLGDIFFKDEWHLSQLSSFLLLPFVKLFTLFTGSTKGILLAARYLYIAFHLCVSIVIYLRLRKYGFASVVASVLYFIFTPYDIMALSYNTMGLDFVTLSGILVATSKCHKKVIYILSGFCFACAVLCNPYLIFVYIFLMVYVAFNFVINKKHINSNYFCYNYFSINSFLSFTLGAILIAIPFLALLLSRTNIEEIITALPYMMSDPEHPSMSLIQKGFCYLSTMWNCVPLFKYALIGYICLYLVILFDKKRKNIKYYTFFSLASLSFFRIFRFWTTCYI